MRAVAPQGKGETTMKGCTLRGGRRCPGRATPRGVVTLAVLLAGAAPAAAQAAGDGETRLEARVTQLEAQLREMKDLVRTLQSLLATSRGPAPAAGPGPAGEATLGPAAGPRPDPALEALDAEVSTNRKAIEEIQEERRSEVKLSTKGGIQAESADGRFKARLGGRIMVDAAFYDQDKSRLGDGTEVRSARLFLLGTLFGDWNYKSQFDFADAGISIRDLYLQYAGFAPHAIKVGHFKEPFGLSERTSRKYITFMERALPDLFAPGRHIGVALESHGEDWTAEGGVFGSNVSGDAPGEGDEGWDLDGRVTYAPVHGKDRAVHLGAAARLHTPQNESTRYRTRPESHITGARLVDTGTLMNVDNAVTVQPEAAFVYGPFAAQGEYVRHWVNRSGVGDDLTFDGWYAQASYFLTGESRNYQPHRGGFSRVAPAANLSEGGPGAWELAVRYSTLDLSDGSVQAGQEDNWTIGLNWHANSHLRFMFNYIFVNTDNAARGNAGNLLPGQMTPGDDDPQIFQFRTQVDF